MTLQPIKVDIAEHYFLRSLGESGGEL